MERRASWKTRSAGAAAWAVVGAALLAFAGFRVVALELADHWARAAPARALALVPRHPAASIALAERELGSGKPAEAAETARALLAVEPARGEALRILALAADRQGDAALASRAMRIAVRRAPRDMVARGWLAEDEIAHGHYAAGIAQLEAVMRLSPRHVDILVPLLAALADDPEFSAALNASLARNPRWKQKLVEHISRRSAATPSGRMATASAASVRARSLRLGSHVARFVDPRGLVPAGR